MPSTADPSGFARLVSDLWDRIDDAPAAGLAAATRAREAATADGDRRASAAALAAEARASDLLGHPGHGMEAATHALSEGMALGDATTTACALAAMAGVLAPSGAFAHARRVLRAGLDLGETVPPLIRTSLHEHLGMVSLVQGDLERADAECVAAVRAARENGSGCRVAHLNLAQIRISALADGPWGPERDRLAVEALGHADRALASSEGARYRGVQALSSMAEALAWSGHGQRALDAAGRAVRLAAPHGLEAAVNARTAQAAALAACGARPAALAVAEGAVALARPGGEPWLEATKVVAAVRLGAYAPE